MAQFSNFQPATEAAADALARLGEVVNSFVDPLGNIGVLVAVDVEGVGRVTLTAGHSDIEKTRAVQPDDIFQIGSQSKTVTAMTLLSMARQGLLNLDDPAVKFVNLPIDRRITVRQLLMNTSGLGEYTWALFGRRTDVRIQFEPRDLVALALPQGQVFEPGACFDYSNTGWVIAAMIIEAIGGIPYSAAVDQRILKPLGLKSSGFGGSLPAGERMRCYMSVPGEAEPLDTSGAFSWGFGAGDGLCSAADVIAIFASLMREDSPLGISLHDLAATTAKPSASPYFPPSFGTEYGIGIERRAWAGSEVWGHPGSTGACRSSTWIDAKRRVAVATAATTHVGRSGPGDDIRYPREQLFSMALNTAYALAQDRR